MKIMKIISGGQTGADIAGLKAALQLGIQTGGWMPRGFRTLDGDKPEYEALYGLKEHKSPMYPPRTRLNVIESDGTIRFARDFGSPGELCTLRFLREEGKPYFDVDIDSPPPVEDILETCYNIKILNIAGNSERTAPGIEEFVTKFLVILLKE